ncbi:helix-turn-helix domain-containing protein [Photobacterium indicum]|uniref:helix-turn-helix domain-containing protein n=1 Tax=Photobacterium indicum TaxID=81447 RepID=UPI001472EB52|nr:helix-turn-helix domain-containing protein [Photobacterium indicum]
MLDAPIMGFKQPKQAKATDKKVASPFKHSDQLVAAAQKTDLSIPVKALLLEICSRANKSRGWTLFPSLKSLADAMGRTTRSVRTYLRELEKLGYIKTTAQYKNRTGYDNERSQVANLYTVNVAKLAYLAKVVANKVVQKLSSFSGGRGKQVSGLKALLTERKKEQSSFQSDYKSKSKRAADQVVESQHRYREQQDLEYDMKYDEMAANKVSRREGLSLVSGLKAKLFGTNSANNQRSKR